MSRPEASRGRAGRCSASSYSANAAPPPTEGASSRRLRRRRAVASASVGDAAVACVSPALARGGVSVRVGDAFGEFGRVGRDVAVATTRDDVFAETRDAETRGADAGRLDRPTATAAYPDVASPFGGARLVIAGASLDRARGGGVRFGDTRVRFAAMVSSALAFVEAPSRARATTPRFPPRLSKPSRARGTTSPSPRSSCVRRAPRRFP